MKILKSYWCHVEVITAAYSVEIIINWYPTPVEVIVIENVVYTLYWNMSKVKLQGKMLKSLGRKNLWKSFND